ncbi:IS66 family insertion sequence element accessory protein TnpA (plasmid) [Methylomonas sp. MS20]|uniref:IS66 family insertion sequence element accessory protein TnpA n=1 Tax=Methylomonas sp. MS20 TaxID=3418769 RepID=UPI003D035A29
MALSVDWGQQIQAWQCSGLSQAAYCRQQGLNYGTFTMRLSVYRKRLSDAATSSTSATTLIPVQIQSPVTHAAPSDHDVIRLMHSGSQLELPMSTPVGWLAELLQCLA